MTRCLEFYQKWEELPNFCEVAERTARQIEAHLKIVKELESRGLTRKKITRHLTERAARPLHGADGPVRDFTLDRTADLIRRGTSVSRNDLVVWIELAKKKSGAMAPRPTSMHDEKSDMHVPRTGTPTPGSACTSAPAPLTFTRGLPGTPGAVVVETVPATRKTAPEPAVPLRLGSANVVVTAEDAAVLTWLVKTGRAKDPLDAAQRVFDEGIDRIRDHMDGEESRERDAREGK